MAGWGKAWNRTWGVRHGFIIRYLTAPIIIEPALQVAVSMGPALTAATRLDARLGVPLTIRPALMGIAKIAPALEAPLTIDPGAVL